MPLASNSTAAVAAAAKSRKSITAVPIIPKPNNKNSNNENNQLSSKQPFSVIHSNHPQQQQRRRDSISSICSTGSNGTTTTTTSSHHNLHRMSLPKSLPSTTVVTKSKVDRRRSLIKAKEHERQQQQQQQQIKDGKKRSNSDTENENNEGYSPPETRSAKKKRKGLMLEINPSFFDENNRSNALLQFSPPDHIKNQLRQQELIQQKEHERAQRIAAARRNGQLLVHSSTDMHNDAITESSDHNVPLPLTQKIVESTIDVDLLKKMSDDVSRLAQDQIEARNERRMSDAHLLQKVHEMIAKEKEAISEQSVSALQSTAQILEQNNIKFMEEIKELSTKLVTEKESYSKRTTQLELQIQQSQDKIGTLENLQSELQQQILTLEAEKTNAILLRSEFQYNLEVKQRELCEALEMLEDMKSNINRETKDSVNKLNQLQVENKKLQEEIDRERVLYQNLELQVQEKDETIQLLQHDTIPSLQASIEMEQGTVARLEQKIDDMTKQSQELQSQIQEKDDTIKHLQCDIIPNLQTSIESERDTVKLLEQKIIDMSEQMKQEIQQLTDANMNIQTSNASFLIHQKQLNDALEESMMQLDQTEKEKRNVEVKLKQALQQVVVVTKERDDARNNMDGFNDREQKLYDQLQHYEQVRREMHSKLMQLMGNIRVFVRVRPKLENEEDVVSNPTAITNNSNKRMSMNGSNIIANRRHEKVQDVVEEEIFRFPGSYESTASSSSSFGSSSDDITKNIIEVTAPYKDRGGLNDRRKQWTFGFDHVFAPNTTQQNVWDATEPLIQCAVDGYNVTIFAYGQTGSGKTYTMLGEEGANEGIISRTVRKLFDEKQKMIELSRSKSNITMFVELLEIYNEKVRDLLSSGKEDLKITSSEVVGNILVETSTVEEVLQVLKLAQSRRCVKATNSNNESSRSHMIFTIHFKVVMADGVTIRNGKVNICDLAGSERLDKSGANSVGGALLEETKNINKSLSVLSNVIERLQSGDTKNVPFRESKLTFLLKDSLSGNSKTLAIICCNPLASHMNESLCSLRFAEKVNRVDLKAVANFSC